MYSYIPPYYPGGVAQKMKDIVQFAQDWLERNQLTIPSDKFNAEQIITMIMNEYVESTETTPDVTVPWFVGFKGRVARVPGHDGDFVAQGSAALDHVNHTLKIEQIGLHLTEGIDYHEFLQTMICKGKQVRDLCGRSDD